VLFRICFVCFVRRVPFWGLCEGSTYYACRSFKRAGGGGGHDKWAEIIHRSLKGVICGAAGHGEKHKATKYAARLRNQPLHDQRYQPRLAASIRSQVWRHLTPECGAELHKSARHTHKETNTHKLQQRVWLEPEGTTPKPSSPGRSQLWSIAKQLNFPFDNPLPDDFTLSIHWARETWGLRATTTRTSQVPQATIRSARMQQVRSSESHI